MKFCKSTLSAYLGDRDEFEQTRVEKMKEGITYFKNTKIVTQDMVKHDLFDHFIKDVGNIFKDVTSEGLGYCKEGMVLEEKSDKNRNPTMKK